MRAGGRAGGWAGGRAGGRSVGRSRACGFEPARGLSVVLTCAATKELGINIKISDYHQSAISSGSDAQAAAYIELEKDGQTKWGVGINPNTTRASFEAIIVGLSKIL